MPNVSVNIGELKRHFNKSLRCLRDYPGIPRVSNYMYDCLKSQFSDFKKQSDENNWVLDISPQWEIPILDNRSGFSKNEHGQPNAHALIGGIVRVVDGCLSEYSFTLCLVLEDNLRGGVTASRHCNIPSCCLGGRGDMRRIVRKFHFDINTGDQCDRPTFHFQYGGEFKEKTFYELLHYCLDHGIEKPRLPYPPFDFVLILDLLIEQFDNLKSLDGTDWRSLVKDSQEILLRGYYTGAYNYFSCDRKKTFLEFLGEMDGPQEE